MRFDDIRLKCRGIPCRKRVNLPIRLVVLHNSSLDNRLRSPGGGCNPDDDGVK